MEEDNKIKLKQAVAMAAWTPNMNVNVMGYLPLKSMTEKSIMFPGLTTGNLATESLHDDNTVRSIMETQNTR